MHPHSAPSNTPSNFAMHFPQAHFVFILAGVGEEGWGKVNLCSSYSLLFVGGELGTWQVRKVAKHLRV